MYAYKEESVEPQSLIDGYVPTINISLAIDCSGVAF